jgi:DNA repair exonuclease SbcCD ATPase subunit
VRLGRIELPAFGCLRGFEAELRPGLNVFLGPNEAGKSTLQQAVLALLYGFYDQDRARPDETARHERFRPWSGDDFSGILEYELSDGRCLQVRRDFTTADVPTQLIDLTTGVDIASELGQGRHGNIPLGRRHLGMSRAVFQSCAFISQGEIFEVSRGASPREIGDAIAALADSARRDVSAANAIQRLSGLIGKIGSDRARTAELPRARDHLSTAQEELRELDEARRAMSETAAEVDRLQHRLTEFEDEIARTEILLARAQAGDLECRLHDLSEADRALSEAQARREEMKPYSSVPSHLRDEVQSLAGRRHTATANLQRLRAELTDAQAPLDEDARLQYAALRAEVGSLSPEQLQTLQRAAYAPPAPVRGLPATLLAGVRAVARTVAGMVRRLIRLILSKQAAPAEEPASEPSPTMTAPEAALVLEKHRRFLTLRPTFDTLARLESDDARANTDLTAIDRQLQGILGDAASAHGDIQASIAAFLQACDRRREYESALAAEEDAARRRRALLRDRSPAELGRQRQQLSDSLERLLAGRPDLEGIETDSALEEIDSRLDALRDQREQAKVREAQLKGQMGQAYAQHRSHSEIEEEVERWQREVSRLERARAAAQTAKETIEEAVSEVYRDFAPRVNEFLSEGVDFVTEGRYDRAFVDPSTLQISLEVPEIRRVISDPPVSHGTRTLIYVLMRIGLAQHMSAIGEPVPLVLDDPFVDIDSRRLPRLLDFLGRLSQERDVQILLFSKDDDILHSFQDDDFDVQPCIRQLPPLDEPQSTVAPTILNRHVL